MGGTAVITGATSGLGYEFAKLLGQDGYRLVLVARNEERLKEIQAEHPEWEMLLLPKDLSRPHAAREVFEELEKRGWAADVLINNAGFGLVGDFDELGADRQVEMVQLNIGALTELTRLVLPGMKVRRRGRILQVASMAAFVPGPRMAVYCASKAYVLSLSEALAEELAGTGVTVTALCPGPTKTGFGAAAGAEGTKMFGGRVMTAERVARLGIAVMHRGRRVLITGATNRLGRVAALLVPRRLAAKFAKSLTARV
ncbi:SDR family NAD(P)-dependent oxidoreductase [Gorillibacterium sp. sgz500922]|uniref:SDR family NAD(P)-dependent oxidoreductase n=1 Tax=Gorillibacterium sp. sgz500922 TaxID=3446694 RepID=UPI003F67C2AF